MLSRRLVCALVRLLPVRLASCAVTALVAALMLAIDDTFTGGAETELTGADTVTVQVTETPADARAELSEEANAAGSALRLVSAAARLPVTDGDDDTTLKATATPLSRRRAASVTLMTLRASGGAPSVAAMVATKATRAAPTNVDDEKPASVALALTVYVTVGPPASTGGDGIGLSGGGLGVGGGGSGGGSG
jgi:hypothetical protein